jgi:hypothetical protein
VFELERDESRAGDGGGVEADSAQGLEDDPEQGVGAYGETVYAPDDLVERLPVLGELAALWLLDRVAEAGASVLVAQVGQGGQVQGGGEAVEGVRLERHVYLILPSAGETSPAARRLADQLLRIHPAGS